MPSALKRPPTACWRISLLDSASLRVSVRALGVVEHALEVDNDGRLVADYPSIVTAGQQRHIARLAIELGAVVHLDPQHAGHVVLKVRRLAALGLRQRLHGCGPAPARLEYCAA